MRRSEALWYVGDGRASIRAVDVPDADGTHVTVRALYSGISRGTERLVFDGRVPPSEYQRMRCPHQEGAFPFPVKYGYAFVGEIESGPRAGEAVFTLHPHQRIACVAASDAHALPAGLPPRRAALTANMETALNVVWDADVAPGQHVLIIGGGVLGLLIAGVATAIPQTQVTVADPDMSRAPIAAALGARFCTPGDAPADQHIVIHTSATEDGLRRALDCAGTEATIVEASWYGDRTVNLPLGEAFHARRLKLVSSQVGMIAPSHRAEWTYACRLQAAMQQLCDTRYEALITGEIDFAAAPRQLPTVLAGGSSGLMTVLRY